MREPAAKLHRPVAALRRLQFLAGKAQGIAANDRNPHQQAQLQSVLREAFDVALAATTGGPLPKPRDHNRAL